MRDWWRRFWATRHGPYVVAFVLQAALAPWFIHDWDGFVFIRTVEQLVGGVTPYAVAQDAPSYIFLNEDWPTPNSWYAYPPGPLLLMAPVLGVLVLLGVAALPVLRLALKLPLIAANLALAYAVGRLVQDLGGDERARRRAELFVLFNPFLIFIAAIWGMFDAAMMALLLASIMLLHRHKPVLAGAAFALAALVKIFPLFVSPAFLIVALRMLPRKRDAAAFVTSAVGTFALVCLPFFVGAPQGFYQQVLGMHLARPPQGFPPVNLLHLPRFTDARFGFALWDNPEPWVVPAVSLALLVPTLLLVYAYAAVGRADARRLVMVALLGLTAAMLFGKVVNEQYFVMPLALLSVLAFAPGASRLGRAGLAAVTWGALVAALVVGFHFLTFLPRETAMFLVGMPAGEAIYGLGVGAEQHLGIPPLVFYVIPDILSGAAVAPAFALLAAFLARHLWRDLAPMTRAALEGTAARRTFAIGAVLLLLATGPAAFAATHEQALHKPLPDPMPELGEKLVGATYYVWWNNPSRDPGRADGNWEGYSLTPAQGFFTTNGHQMETDATAMRSAGIDFAAISFHGYDRGRYEVFAKVARATGLYFAPIIEAGELLGYAEHRTFSEEEGVPIALRPDEATADRLKSITEEALRVGGSDAFLRIDGAHVVFVRDAHLVGPSWDDGSKRALAHEVLQRYNGSYANLSASWGRAIASFDDLLAAYPATYAEFRAADLAASDWRYALDVRKDILLDHVRQASATPMHLVATASPYFARLDDAFPYWSHNVLNGTFASTAKPAEFRPPAAWSIEESLAAWERQAVVESIKRGDAAWAVTHHAIDDTGKRPADVAIALAPDALDGDTYATTWDDAMRRGATRVLIHSWNDFFDGTAIQPTTEHGASALDATRQHVARFRADESEPARRVLAIVNEHGGLADVTRDKKDWTFALSLQLPWRLWEAEAGDARIDVRQLDAPLDLPPEALAEYDAVWLETGSNAFRETAHFATLHQRLMDYVHQGGALVLLGGGLPAPFVDAYLAEGIGHVHADRVNVTWDGGVAAYADTDRYLQVRISSDCESIATFELTGSPAAWRCHLGEGTLVATAFKPQGWENGENESAAGAMRLLVEAIKKSA